jgi:hypothetical protein
MLNNASSIDPFICRWHICHVKVKKPTPSEGQRKSAGTELVEKYRPRMSRLTDTERQKLMSRGLQIIYGHAPAPKSPHRH